MIKQTLCWNCKNNCGPTCCWASEFKTVEGWEVEKNGCGYLVKKCPLFERDKQFFDRKDVRKLIAKHFNISPVTARQEYSKYLHKYTKECGYCLPLWVYYDIEDKKNGLNKKERLEDVDCCEEE